MRIALLSAWSSPRAGGVGAYVSRLITLLEQAGHHLCLVHEDQAPERSLASRPHLRAHRVAGLSQRRTRTSITCDDALAALEGFRPDVVHVHDVNHIGLLDALRVRYPMVRSVHNHAQQCPAGTRLIDGGRHVCARPLGAGCLGNMLVRQCSPVRNPATLWEMYRQSVALNRVDRYLPVVCVASQYVHAQMLASGFSPEQLLVVPYFTEPPPRWAGGSGGSGSDSPTGTVLFTGRIVADKGLSVLLQALPLVRAPAPWRLLVDGAGPDEQRARKIAAQLKLGDQVEFRGWCPPPEHARNFAEADVVVVPSMWPEPFGLVGIEAMSYGKPVVAFAVGGIVDWLRHGETGFLVPRGDVADLARRIEQLLVDSTLAAALGENGRQRANVDYSPGVHLQRMEGVYARTIQRYAVAA